MADTALFTKLGSIREKMNNPSNIHGTDKMLPAVKTKWGFIDRKGNIVIEPVFDWAYPFSEGFTGVLMNGQWGFIDANGNMVIPPIYAYAEEFSSGLAPVLAAGDKPDRVGSI